MERGAGPPVTSDPEVFGRGPGIWFPDDDPSPRALPWAIVLAGGDGARLRPAILDWLGVDRPKQFCTLHGDRSLLQQALDRAARVATPERTVCVIRHGQQAWLRDALEGPPPGPMIVQPGDAGTLGAVFSALAGILARAPRATVVVLPSDHHVEPESAFAHDVVRACLFTRLGEHRIALLAAAADGAAADRGWIGAGAPVESQLGLFLGRRVLQAREVVARPSRAEARRLLRQGYLLNTGAVAARAAALWDAGRYALGSRMRPFEALRRVLTAVRAGRVPAEHVSIALRSAFRDAAPLDVARDLLQVRAVARKCLVLPLTDVTWRGLDTVERVAEVVPGHPIARAPTTARALRRRAPRRRPVRASTAGGARSSRGSVS